MKMASTNQADASGPSGVGGVTFVFKEQWVGTSEIDVYLFDDGALVGHQVSGEDGVYHFPGDYDRWIVLACGEYGGQHLLGTRVGVDQNLGANVYLERSERPDCPPINSVYLPHLEK